MGCDLYACDYERNSLGPLLVLSGAGLIWGVILLALAGRL